MNVIVIGAGVIGAAVAESLAQRGASVTVLDMRSPGRGASQASAGILAPYIEADSATPLLELGTRSLALYDAWIARLRETSGRPIEYARTGTLEVALDEAGETRLRRDLAWLASAGVNAEWLDAATVRSAERAVSDAARGGVLIPSHGLVGVTALIAALVQSARLAGAVFTSPVEAALVEPRRDGVSVRAGEALHAADAAVIAAGSWSRRVRVAGVAALPVRPVRGQLLHLSWTAADLPSRVVWGPGCYTVPWTDGSLLVGATMEDVGFDERSTVDGVQTLTAAVRSLLPGSAAATVDAVRVGLRPATPDGLPAIGPLARAPRVTIATGHFRNGILLAPLTAEIVTASVLDGRVDEMSGVVSPNRFL